ncbi:D-alanine--D-alanine ligase [Olsenella sp. YH-ols2217]|uniref:D-alanine--D-alanine ligase n=1 Tax=Kribbibacterium absianum TaxID=3044210 RepID=A0ABT6ZMP8_9ACTN|nr:MULTISPECIES: D-alanine--D-alanine ligase [unclassified Olsenella]MDJ1122247.1 D-alanine--D-alanine ligase [Olsenella sp. YH-ols2216]MDJ1130339.1 D-alanine--D-alanine ligase [Olsenella sp. YH-ols2217]
MAKPSVAVIMGGSSFERAFSLKSGRNVVDALRAAGHDVIPLDADENLVNTLRDERPDVAFVALHGAGGEDGAVPSLLEFLHIPYVGSEPPVCRTTWSKPELPFVLRRAFRPEDSVVRWPAQFALPAGAFRNLGAAQALDLMPEEVGGFPLAVKPACGGSAMGLSKVEGPDQLGEALMAALAFDDTALVQEWVPGVELSVTVIGEPGDEDVLPPVEIAAKGLFDTDARMTPDAVDYYCPVRPESLSSDPSEAAAIRSQCERAAIEVFRAFGCRDMARVDMVWDGAEVKVLDLKVFPGLTDTSLVPMAIEAAGLTMEEVLERLVATAHERGM